MQPQGEHRARVQTATLTRAVPAKAAPHSGFVPMLLGELAVLGWLGLTINSAITPAGPGLAAPTPAR